MGLQITNRPEKTLVNGYNSRWNSSELPLKYTFLSDLYPVNSVDSAFTVTSGGYNYALKGYELTIGVHNLISLDSTQISGTGTSLDGGIFTIKTVTTNTIILDFFTTEVTTIGSVIKYYNNYNGVVKVYAGARDGHPYNVDNSKPFNLIGEIVVNFNTDNEGSVDVRSYIKPDITADFDANNENSHFAWTDFTIEYSENYDKSDGTNINTFNSGFVPDEQDNCAPFAGFVDPSFDNGLTDWLQEAAPTGLDVWVTGVGSITSPSTQGTNVVYQNLQIYNGVPYSFAVNFDLSITNLPSGVSVLVFGKNTGSWDFLYTSPAILTAGNHVLNIDITPSKDYENIGIAFRGSGVGLIYTIQLNTLQVTTNVLEPCKIYSSAIFGAKQFQDALGGNFGDYVLNIVDEFTPKMLTHFKELRKFQDVDFYVNALIPESTFTLSEGSDNVYLEINLFDSGNNNVLAINYKVNNVGSGVYTVNPKIDDDLDFNNVLPCGWVYGQIRFIIIPSNTFQDADNGTFENGTSTGLTGLSYSGGTPNQIGSSIAVNSFGRTGVFSGLASFDSPFMNQVSKQYSIFKNDTSLNVIIDRVYEIKSYISVKNSIPSSHIDNGSYYWLPDGYTKEECIIKPFEIVTANIYVTLEPTANDWYEITTKFTAKATESLTLTLFEDIVTDINSFTQGVFNIDDITFKGPFEYISEEKKVNNSCGCSYGNILRWKNDLGGWEIWDFQNKRIESEVVSNKINIKRDVTQDWDNYYINGETENDTIKTDVSRSMTFNSQILTNDEYKSLQAIKRSVRVQMLQESGKWQTVTVKAGSYDVVNNNQDIKELSVTFNLPSTKTQEQ